MNSGIRKEYWFVVMAGILSGLIVFGGEIFKRWGFSLLELSILAYFPSIIFLPFFLKGKKSQIFNVSNLKLLLLWSFFAGMVVICQFGAIMSGAPVALVVLLLYTQPIWTFIISKIFFKSNITSWNLLSLFLVISGIVILISPWKINNFGNLNGIILALLGGVALSGWISVGNYVGKSKIDPYVGKLLETIMGIIIITIVLSVVSFSLNKPELIKFSLNWSISIWLALIGYCLLTQIIGHILYLKGSKVVPAKEAGIIMLLEPVSGAILAAIFLRQGLTLNIVFGGVLILLANYLVMTQKRSEIVD